MIDRPGFPELLMAVAEALSGDVLVAIDRSAGEDDLGRRGADGAAYTVRIAANLCRILARQADLGPAAERATIEDLQRFLDRSGPLDELAAALDQALGDDPIFTDGRSAELYEILLADAERRLAIARPDYVRRNP